MYIYIIIIYIIIHYTDTTPILFVLQNYNGEVNKTHVSIYIQATDLAYEIIQWLKI